MIKREGTQYIIMHSRRATRGLLLFWGRKFA